MAPSAQPIEAQNVDRYELADLAVIDYQKVLSKDTAENARLLSACTDWGFFYLDFGDDSFANYRESVEQLFAAGRKYFSQPLEVKKQDTRADIELFNICGFKPMGAHGYDAGNMTNKKNGSEAIRVPIDLFLNPGVNPRIEFPAGLKGHRELFQKFMCNSHEIAFKILESLSDSVGLQGEDRFEASHRPEKLSTTTSTLQYYPLTDLPPDTAVGHFTHTDTGSVTVLFNSDWGLQVFSPVTSKWEYVAPKPGCAIVNIGDTLKFLSKFQLKSSLHRVVPWHGRWKSGPRYATIFFLRANNEVKFTDTEGMGWTAQSWLNRKFHNYRIPHEDQKKNAISTGKKGFAGLWNENFETAAVL